MYERKKKVIGSVITKKRRNFSTENDNPNRDISPSNIPGLATKVASLLKVITSTEVSCSRSSRAELKPSTSR
ncbi:unnamed protein product [Coffea canephora]|uniref:Uncharacterized protein n=1 Tax=Coffea canephora TaxID=49390 RepID=A0A068UZR7_COFCA|nr:unnamed protein product [Coffea canephora]